MAYLNDCTKRQQRHLLDSKPEKRKLSNNGFSNTAGVNVPLSVIFILVIASSSTTAKAEMGDPSMGYGWSLGPTVALGVSSNGVAETSWGVESSIFGYILALGIWASGSYLSPTEHRGANVFGEVGFSYVTSVGLGGGVELAPNSSSSDRGRFHFFLGQAIPLFLSERKGIILYVTPFVRPTYFFR